MFFLNDELSSNELLIAEYPFMGPVLVSYELCQADLLDLRVEELEPEPVVRAGRSQ